MTAYISERQVLAAIANITTDTGYPPDVDELAYALDVTPRQVQSSLTQAKRRGAVLYDDAERFLLVPKEQQQP